MKKQVVFRCLHKKLKNKLKYQILIFIDLDIQIKKKT